MNGLAQLATEEYHARRDNALRKIEARKLGIEDATVLLRPWLALAIRMGADPGILHLQLAGALQELLDRPMDEGLARVILADDFCPRAAAVETLALARDAAIDRAEETGKPERIARARRLIALADAFGARAYRMRKLPEAA